MIEKIFTSKTISPEKKKEAFSKLAEIDKSDMLGRTTKYCEACIPDLEAKKAIWTAMMKMKEDVGITACNSYCRGLRQFSQLDILD